jgi:hypothetical protein
MFKAEITVSLALAAQRHDVHADLFGILDGQL